MTGQRGEQVLSTACVTALSPDWCPVPVCPCSCLRRRADLPDPHRPDQHHCTRSSHGILSSTSDPAGRRGRAEERSASNEEQARTLTSLLFSQSAPQRPRVSSTKSWSFLVMLWNALWRICFYLKMQSKDRHLLMLCVVTVKPWVKCQTHSVRYVNLVVAVRRKGIGEIFVWLQIRSYKHQDELLFWSYSHVVSFPGFFPLASCMLSPCCWPTCTLHEFFLDCLTSFSCFGFSPPGAERLKQRLKEQLFLLTEVLWSQ